MFGGTDQKNAASDHPQSHAHRHHRHYTYTIIIVN